MAELLEERDERRRAGRLAALRGLRALPVHAGGDQERDADAVRDRLPARLRAGRSTRPTTTSSCGACVEGDGEITRRGALPAAERRAPPAPSRTRIAGSRGASSSASVAVRDRGSTVEPRRRRRRRGVLPGREPHAGARPGSTAAEALRHSLISTHPILRVTGGARFVSQLDAPCDSVNTWPVLASPDDDVMLGAAIVLPGPPADRAREPRQPLRQHRDRGGARPARAGAERRRARGDRAAGPAP